ncbi:MAG: PRC-barrel domain-containing protein [Ilumatobacteraceae bacterium]
MSVSTPLRLVRAADLLGLPVVALDSGEDVAEVRDVVYHAGDRRLVGFTLNKRGTFAGRLRHVLGAGQIASIGRDAVMIEAQSIIEDRPDQADVGSDGSDVSIMGLQVMTVDGTVIGSIAGVVLETGSPATVVGYELETPDRTTIFLPIDIQVALSSDRLLVPENTAAYVHQDLVGFGGAVAQYREQTLGSTGSPDRSGGELPPPSVDGQGGVR